MDEPGNDFLAGLLEFASLPESNSNSNNTTPPPRSQPSTNTALRCGFCLKVKYKNQSSLDSHIQACALSHNFKAKFWREAGWTRARLEAGFTFADDYPVVKTNRICKYCQKTFANAREAQKHVSAARCINAQAVQDAAPAVTSGQWKCGFCGNDRCYTSESALDSHIKLCAPRNGYLAKFWKDAGWEPGSRFGKGLDFKDGVVTAKSERICQVCYQCCKSLNGLTRHLERELCPRGPDEKGQKPPPPYDPKTIAHLAQHGVAVSEYRIVASQTQQRTVEFNDSRAALSSSTRTEDEMRTQRPPNSSVKVPKNSSTSAPKDSKNDSGSHKLAVESVQKKSSRPENTSPEIDFLSKVINTAPSPAITELLIKIARSNPASRAISSAPLLPRQKRTREQDPIAEPASRTKVARDAG